MCVHALGLGEETFMESLRHSFSYSLKRLCHSPRIEKYKQFLFGDIRDTLRALCHYRISESDPPGVSSPGCPGAASAAGGGATAVPRRAPGRTLRPGIGARVMADADQLPRVRFHRRGHPDPARQPVAWKSFPCADVQADEHPGNSLPRSTGGFSFKRNAPACPGRARPTAPGWADRIRDFRSPPISRQRPTS